ncbi:hypothetical protein TNCV_636061 [Trichonephila clavipes]|nr:hypothetical protein TNCV_636061 [Trichonephila clavipes]
MENIKASLKTQTLGSNPKYVLSVSPALGPLESPQCGLAGVYVTPLPTTPLTNSQPCQLCYRGHRITLSGTFRLLAERNMPPILAVSTTDVFSFPISCLSYWMQSKGRTRLDVCKTSFDCLAGNSSRYTMVRAPEEPLCTYVTVRLMPSSDLVQMSMLWGDLGRSSW